MSQTNNCIYGSVWTYANISDKSEVIISFIEEFVDKVVVKVCNKSDLTFSGYGNKLSSKDYNFHRSWNKNKNKYFKKNMEKFYLDNEDNIYLTVDNNVEEEYINIIGFSVESDKSIENLYYEIQEDFKKILNNLYIKLNCIGGLITLDKVATYSGETAHENYIGVSYIWASRENKYEEYFRGYFWGNYINNTQLSKLGGINKLKEMKEFYEIRELEDGGVYIQLSDRVDNFTDKQLETLKSFFKPILMTRGDKIVYPRQWSNMRVIIDENDNNNFHDVNKTSKITDKIIERNQSNKSNEEKSNQINNKLINNEENDFDLEYEESNYFEKISSDLNIPIIESEDLTPSDIRMTIKVKNDLDKEQEEYITNVLESWYIVGMHKGFEENRIHYLHEIEFDDENNIIFSIDMGNCSPNALITLFNILIDVISLKNNEVMKIILD